jgi:hypothetical protein
VIPIDFKAEAISSNNLRNRKYGNAFPISRFHRSVTYSMRPVSHFNRRVILGIKPDVIH